MDSNQAFAGDSTEITLAQAAALLPRIDGRKVHVMTVKRWAIKGCHGVHLVAKKLGRRWLTTPAAVARFRDECTMKATGTATSPTTFDRQMEITASRERLRSKGFYRTRNKRDRNVTDENSVAKKN